MPTVLIAGTGSHLVVGSAIADALEAESRDPNIHFVACRPDTDPPLLRQEGRAFDLFPMIAPPRAPSLRLLRAANLGMRACAATRRLIRSLRPDVLFATGAYGSGPPALAAWLARVPIILFEPEIEPTLATRLLAPFSRAIACAHTCTLTRVSLHRARLTGMPLRKAFLTVSRPEARASLGLSASTPYLFCTGGSQGARSLNQTLWDALPALFARIAALRICHTTGAAGYAQGLTHWSSLPPNQRERYRMVERLDSSEMARVYAAADVAVTRTGANTIAELDALNVPAVLIPYPFAAGGHQHKNAEALVQSGQALLLEDSGLSPDTLLQHVRALLREPGADRPTRQDGAREAAKRVANLILETAAEACRS